MTLATSGISAGNDILSFTRSGNRTASASTSAGGFSGSYAYDLAGRMTTDGLRAHRYTYNLKGMTQSVCDSSGTALVTYTYHEDGTKKSESYPDGSGRLYYGPVEYTFSGGSMQNAHLDLVHFGNGVYRKKENDSWQTLWFVRDRTGSVVSVLDISYPYRNISDEGVLVSQMGYSPYGTEIAGEGFAQDSTLRYRYASKERQDTWQVLPETSGVAAYRSTIPGIINFGARMYDPLTSSWLVPDPLAHKYTSLSPYVYCAANPVNFVDPDGRFVGALFDAASVTLGVKNLIDNVRLGNTRAAIGDGIGIAIDVVAAALPVVPGGVGILRAAKKGTQLSAELLRFEKAAEFGVDNHKNLLKMIHETIGKGSGLEVHHLIEQRFASKLGIKEADIPSIVLTKDEHRKFTHAWRNEIGYYRTGEKTRNTQTATKEEIFESAKTIYQDYPEILNVIEKMMK